MYVFVINDNVYVVSKEEGRKLFNNERFPNKDTFKKLLLINRKFLPFFL